MAAEGVELVAALARRREPPRLVGSRLDLREGSFETDLGAHDLETRLRVKRELEGGWFQWIAMPLPALLTIQSGINQLRYATLKGIMAAKKKPLDVKDAERTVSILLGGGSPVGAAEPVGSSSGPVVSSTTVGPAASFWPTSTDSSNGFRSWLAANQRAIFPVEVVLPEP